ncbi:helix-turn-helix domain-containing protein [Hymenobacter sp. UV11]|uniref:helix-turn-helix domain-containing protein n=1 Tax=Hymenobacter sp. UV11 TaxID=1849735 RepID=UPI00105E27FA|nr:helix-turn-helix transcriptional regulator [Hymenobacter sp. UV11]TDN37990.1 hypothetical protein A8B98_01675 [Hymenobacter sp. UV11]TFZ65202.1 helix-turn-helix domain-containing protein [Hymenobacter sp. UV11]
MITRIRQLLDSKELSPTQFADLIGVGRPVVSHILSERNKPSLDVVQRIIGAFPEISLPWLLSGIGNMLDEAAVAAPTPGTTSENDSAAIPATEPEPALPPAPAAPTPSPGAAPPLDPPASPVEAPPVAAARPVAPAKPIVEVAPNAVPAPVQTEAPPARPFRAARFVPAATAVPAPTPAAIPLPAVLPQREPLPLAPSVEAAVAALAAFPVTKAPVASLPPASSPVETAALPFLLEPGKAIRRIVIFYRDGSFADYQPEE